VTVAEAPAAEFKRASDLAEVIVAGDRDVDLALALEALDARGYRRVLAEGGPSLNGQLAAAGLLDELCLTVSPLVVGGEAKRILSGGAPVAGSRWRLCSLCEGDGFLFLRYRPPAAGDLSKLPAAG
jgi:riboflavin biosynthesis pyrimidine reductase